MSDINVKIKIFKVIWDLEKDNYPPKELRQLFDDWLRIHESSLDKDLQDLSDYEIKLRTVIYNLRKKLNSFELNIKEKKLEQFRFYKDEIDEKLNQGEIKLALSNDMILAEEEYKYKLLENAIDYLDDTYQTIKQKYWKIKAIIEFKQYISGEK